MEVFKEDETLYKKQYGYSDVKNKVEANKDTVYEWGAVSEILVWTSVMQLYEENKIDLNADIKEYLPEGFLTKLSSDKPITMLNLMNHNAGWQELPTEMEVTDTSERVDLEAALKMSEPPQIYERGEFTAYFNWGTALVAFIVEEVSGEDYIMEILKYYMETTKIMKMVGDI